MNFVRDYGAPLLLALLLHAGVAAALLRGWEAEADEPLVMTPRIIQAELLVMEKPARKPKPPRAPRLLTPPTPKPEPARPPPRPEPEAPKPPPRPDPDVERRAREEAARQQRLRELMEQSTKLALDEEELVDEGAVEADTMTYADAISRAIVAAWSRPPSARNDMQARLQVDLTPSGDLIGVSVIDTSGNPAFDRSAEVAVRRAAHTLGRFPVPSERRVFEAHFRHFTLLFKPEDLLR